MAKSKPKKPKRPKKPKPKDDCFITTACVQYYSLTDDCFQLELLRSFREDYLYKSSKGRRLVEEYNKIAPLIVSKIKVDIAKDKVLSETFSCIIKACDFISLGQYNIATRIYIRTVSSLVKRYKLGY